MHVGERGQLQAEVQDKDGHIHQLQNEITTKDGLIKVSDWSKNRNSEDSRGIGTGQAIGQFIYEHSAEG